jgi:hypothetical protein
MPPTNPGSSASVAARRWLQELVHFFETGLWRDEKNMGGWVDIGDNCKHVAVSGIASTTVHSGKFLTPNHTAKSRLGVREGWLTNVPLMIAVCFETKPRSHPARRQGAIVIIIYRTLLLRRSCHAHVHKLPFAVTRPPNPYPNGLLRGA